MSNVISFKNFLYVTAFVALLLHNSSAFVLNRSTMSGVVTSSRVTHHTTSGNSLVRLRMVVEEDLLDGLTDHDAEGSRLAVSIAGWLDEEWMPQEVHVKMGESAKTSFITARKSGVNTIAPIMMSVAGDLEENWAEYDDDAFVNAWDIGNYVADYLMDRVGNEGCGCSAKIYKEEDAV